MAAAIPWLPSPTELPRIGAWTYRALLLAIVACLWFPATPLPLGGPNVVLSAVLVFLAGLYVLVSMAAGKGLVLSRTVLGLLAVIAAMLVWAGAVTVFTDTFTVPLVGQIAMGGAVLAATWVAVDTQRRARAVATLIAACTAISVLFGLAVIYIGDPLWRVWVVFANPETRFANDVLLGRIAGISPRVVNLAFQLVVATPLAVGLLLHNPCQEPAKRRAYDIAHYALALTLGVGIYFNTSRSAALAGAFGVAAVLASAVFAPRPDRRVALRRMPLIAVALAAGFAAVVAIHQAYAPDIVRPEEQEVAAECETPLGVISGALESGEVEIAGTWNDRCRSLIIGQRLAHLYTFSVDAPKFVSIELAAEVRPYLYFLRGTGERRELGNQNNENHDGGVGSNARIVEALLPAGDYTVEATTMYPGETGDYTLTINSQCRDESLGVIALDAERKKRTSAWSEACPLSEHDPTRPARFFTFELAESLPIAVYVQGEGLWPTVYLRSIDGGKEWAPVKVSHDTTGDRSKVTLAGFLDLPAGGYRLEVTSELANVVGNFKILVGVPEGFDPVEADDEQEEPGKQKQEGKPGEQQDSTDSEAPVASRAPSGEPGASPGSPGASPGSPGASPGSPGASPGSPGASPGSPGASPGSPGASPGSPGASPGSPGASPGSPGGGAASNKDKSLFDAAPPVQLPLFKPEILAGAPTTDRARLVSLDSQAYDRVQLAITALRYAREFPLGTGGNYQPQARHVDLDWGTRKVQAALAFSPHNQFLLCLVQYGAPGLMLLLLLYGGSAGALLIAWRKRWHNRRSGSWFLFVAAASAVAGYLANSLFHDHGPFTKDWFTCVIIGLTLAIGLRLPSKEDQSASAVEAEAAAQ